MTLKQLVKATALMLIVGVVFGLTGFAAQHEQVMGTEVFAQASGLAIWQLPGKRELDPEIFGTPDNPLKTNWLPVDQREVSEDGMSFTRTKEVTPFSNNIREIQGGVFTLYVNDVTALDTPNSKDSASGSAIFTDPSGKDTFEVILQGVLPVGPDHQMFGGVGTDVFLHGKTEVGTPLVPPTWAHITLWGYGDLYKNGELIDTQRLIHIMVGPRLRDENFQLGFEAAQPNKLEVHLVLPPVKVTSEGPVDSPVPTGYMLPNGVEQPFIHNNYYENIIIRGNKFDMMDDMMGDM